jgi:hypothetical protein
MARCVTDATAHQNMGHNQNDNETIARHTANAEQHCVQHQAEEVEVQDQCWKLDAQHHQLTESSQYVGSGILGDIESIDFANMVPMYHNLIDFVCTHCGDIGFRKENCGTLSSIHFGIICCNSGKTHSIIDPQVVLPDYFQTLFTSDQPIYKYFQKNIQRFNVGLCMV